MHLLICISYIFMIKFETVSRPINAIISLGKVGFLLLAEFLSQTLQNWLHNPLLLQTHIFCPSVSLESQRLISALGPAQVLNES